MTADTEMHPNENADGQCIIGDLYVTFEWLDGLIFVKKQESIEHTIDATMSQSSGPNLPMRARTQNRTQENVVVRTRKTVVQATT